VAKGRTRPKRPGKDLKKERWNHSLSHVAPRFAVDQGKEEVRIKDERKQKRGIRHVLQNRQEEEEKNTVL